MLPGGYCVLRIETAGYWSLILKTPHSHHITYEALNPLKFNYKSKSRRHNSISVKNPPTVSTRPHITQNLIKLVVRSKKL